MLGAVGLRFCELHGWRRNERSRLPGSDAVTHLAVDLVDDVLPAGLGSGHVDDLEVIDIVGGWHSEVAGDCSCHLREAVELSHA